MNKLNPSGRVVIVGAGMVGSTSAYALLLGEIASEIVLIDIAEDLATAHVLDLEDAATFSRGVDVKFGNYQDLVDGDIVVITAGAAQKPGETRTDLLQKNVGISRRIFADINDQNKQLYVVLVTNPVDILTFVAKQELNQLQNRVFGSGTTLDTARLRTAIANQIGVSARNVHAYVLGEHGDASFPVLSSANAGGIRIDSISDSDNLDKDRLSEMVRDKAYKIIEGKQATYFGIGTVVTKICAAIIKDENRIFTLSVKLDGQYNASGVCLGVPVQLNSDGYKFIGEIQLDEEERSDFDRAVQTVKDNIEQINF